MHGQNWIRGVLGAVICLSLMFSTGWSGAPTVAKGSVSLDELLSHPEQTQSGPSYTLAKAQLPAQKDIPEDVQLPVLMYHHLDHSGEGSATIQADLFRAQMEALLEAGYHTVSPQQLSDFVNKGVPLPEQPILITFDDGYTSNYELAFPILKELNMKATIFVIGVHMGRTQYKETGNPITPHFSEAQAREMMASGLITIGSHTFDMHQWAPFESTPRSGVLPLEGEGADAYALALKQDFSTAADELEAGVGQRPIALAYPGGWFTAASESVRRQLGFELSFTVVPKMNTLRFGDPGCLALMGRYTVDDISPQQLLELLAEGAASPSRRG